jgi:ABC-type dipeptide/oligopeptide/nickel transport system permease component
MPPLVRYLVKRFVSIPITLLVITAALYAVVMLTPAETRAALYMPKNTSPRMTEEQYQKMLDRMIERYHLNDPYPVQYFYWLGNLVQGNWGYSPTLQEDVLTAIIHRTPVTAELTLYSILVFIPLGLLSGAIAGARQNKLSDYRFRSVAFIATSLPPFILSLVLLAIFYVGLYWFAPGRTSSAISFFITSDEFRQYTGLLTIDGLLNRRPDISLDALRHLVMPVFTLAIGHWASLGRVTRATMIEEQQKEYVIAARARGIPDQKITWRHTLRNAIAPALTSSMLSAASLLTGVFVVEIIYNFHGISIIAVKSMNFIPDAPAAMGFAIYSVMVVLLLMVVLDLVQAMLDPRVREVD